MSEVPTAIRNSKKPEKACSGVWGHPHVGNSDRHRKFRHSEVSIGVKTLNWPNKRPYLDMAFWILIQTLPDSWETWKKHVGRFPSGIRPPLSLYIRGSWPIEYTQQPIDLFYIYYSFHPNLFQPKLLFIAWSDNQWRPSLAGWPRESLIVYPLVVCS